MNREERMSGTSVAKLNRPSDSTATVPSLREKAKAMYREAVLNAAEQVFTSHGIRGARMQDIAKHAGVSVGTVYNHFAQKEDVITALAAMHDLEIRDASCPKPEDPVDFEGAMRARHERVMRFMKRHMGFYLLAIHEGLLTDLAPSNSPLAAVREDTRIQVEDAMVELLKQGMREGVVEEQDPHRLKHFYTGAMHGILFAVMKDPHLDVLAEGRAALNLFLRAIRRDPHIS